MASNSKNLAELLNSDVTLTATDIANGAVTTDKLADGAITTAKVADTVNLGRRNLIINGDMQVAQRGTSSTSPSGYNTVDRFTTDNNNGTTTVTQENLSSGAPYDSGFRKFFRMTNTTGSTDNDTRRRFYQVVESQNIANSGWDNTSSSSYITLSFWVRTSISGDYYFYIQSRNGTNYSYIWSENLTANTWTKLTKTIPGDSNVLVGNNTSDGIRVVFNAYHGTDFTGSVAVDQWVAFDNLIRYPDDTNGWGTTNGATYDITGIQLEVGDTATPFEHRSYAEELLACQRYCQRINFGSGTHIPTMSVWDTNDAYGGIVLPVEMRGAPTFSYPGGSNFTFQHAGTDITVDYITLSSTSGTNIVGMRYHRAGTGFSSGGAVFGRTNSAGIYWQFEAEL